MFFNKLSPPPPPHDSVICTHLTDLPDASSTGVSRARPITAFTAFTAVALLAFFEPLATPAQAATCQPAQRGTLNANDTFSRGTSARHNDYRVICRGDASGREVTVDHLYGAGNHPNANSFGDNLGGRLVLQLSGAHLRADVRQFPLEGIPRGGLVILGAAGGASGWNEGIDINVREELSADLNIDSHATIRTTQGARGIDVAVDDEDHYYGRLRVRNFGSIETSGGGAAHEDRLARGVVAASRGGAVEVVNESGANIVTRGPGGRGITAGTVGSVATAINRGTITTRGNRYNNRSAEGVAAFAHWDDTTRGGGVARATNEASGTVATYGHGAIGVFAAVGSSGNAGTAAIATNAGRITTRGNAESSSSGADGVAAYSGGGLARATNEARGVIRTHGAAAIGVEALNSYATGSAEVENWGRITTSGHQAGNWKAVGINSESRFNDAYAVNHEGAAISTSGRGARGVVVYTKYGGPNESAVAINRGTVTTRGNAFHTPDEVATADGVIAFSGGEAPAVIVNGYDGVIETRGAGSKGGWAVAYRAGGEAIARNQGLITTHGDPYRVNRAGTNNDTYRGAVGLGAYSESSDATSTNEAGGVVETHGDVAIGMSAWSDGGGTATAVNRGRITTRGGAANDLPGDVGRLLGSKGIQAHSDHADARVVNDTTGRVDTYRRRAFGLFAETEANGSRSSALAEVVNRGQVQTRGYNANGAVAIALHGGTAANPNRVRATNATGATITTAGTGAGGLGAGISVSGGGTKDAYGTLTARNDGTVTTTGGAVGNRAGAFAANGVAATFFAPDNTRIRYGGNVTIVNTGDVTVSGAHASALLAETFGRGTATVRVIGGQVGAEHATGRGLWARTGAAGRVDATIAGGAEVAARTAGNTAAQFNAGRTNVRLLDSTIAGRVVFGGGRDTFTVRNARVTGAIAFAAGADTLNVHGDAWLERGFSGLETLSKRGSGNLVVRGNATFSPGGRAVVENGGLTFTGQFNVGSRGTMRIHDSARLTAVLADPSTPPRITAGGGLTFDGDAELFVQVAPNITLALERAYLTQNRFRLANVNPIANGTRVTARTTGPVALRTARGPSAVVEVGHIPLANGRTQTARTVVRSGVRLGVFDPAAPANIGDLSAGFVSASAGIGSLPSGAGEPELMLGGEVAALGAALFGVFDAEVPEYAQEGTAHGEASAMHGFVESRARDGGLEYWARSWAGDRPVFAGGVDATVRGYALGVDAPLGAGFRLGIATVPAVASSADGARAGTDARLDGARYALRAGWRGEVLHAGLNLSRGRYEAQSVFDNPVTGGGLAGRHDLAQDHAHLGAGARLSWRGIEVTPTVSAYSGVLHHGAHTARGSVFRAEVPEFAQRYQGWKGALRFAPERWLRGPGSLRWRPVVHLYTQRTQSTAPASLEVTQHDRAGVLSLTSRARVSDLPRTVRGLGATVDAVRSENWRLQLRVAGMRTGGDTDRAVLARLQFPILIRMLAGGWTGRRLRGVGFRGPRRVDVPECPQFGLLHENDARQIRRYIDEKNCVGLAFPADRPLPRRCRRSLLRQYHHRWAEGQFRLQRRGEPLRRRSTKRS